MKDLIYVQLFDAYGELLTEHQREICELYYMCDLSLAEIAEQKGVSRQSVSDTLAKSRALLEEYEEKLHLSEISQELARLKSGLDQYKSEHPENAAALDAVLKG